MFAPWASQLDLGRSLRVNSRRHYEYPHTKWIPADDRTRILAGQVHEDDGSFPELKVPHEGSSRSELLARFL
jgi:hypothetical protein